VTKKNTQADGLMAQIRQDPLNDEPRQIYADLLEQRGDVDRAQLIQLQIRRAALRAWDPQVTELELQERALLARHDDEWRAALPQLDGVTWGSFTRGFVGKVAFDSLDAYVAHRDACFAASPVHSIVLRWPETAKPPKLPAVAAISELTMVGAVMRPEDFKWLAGCPLLAPLRSLNLIDSELRSGFPHLLNSPHLARLAALRIPLHLIGNTGISKLTAAALPALTELDLSVGADEQLGSNRRQSASTLGSRGALELAGWAGLARITSLDLSGARLGNDGMTGLLASPYTKALTSLFVRDIANAEWDMDDSLAAFGVGPGGALEQLDLSDNDLDSDAATALVSSRALQKLEVLLLDNVRSRHFDRVAQAAWIHSLRVLSCGESALEPIVKRAPKQLHTIRVVAEGGTAREVVKKLTAVPLPALTSLDLSASRITDPSLRVLGASTALPNLVRVTLAPRRGNNAAFTPKGAADFAASPLGKRLKSLHTGIAELDRLRPRPPIEFGDGEYVGPLRFL
jgi:uncharacterized protein (TIGR02996 family)